MLSLKRFIFEEQNTSTSNWMDGNSLSKHIPKTAIKHIVNSKEHNILVNHNIVHGGDGNLHYRIHTKSYGDYKTQTVQAASSKEDADGFTHHVSFDIIKNSATPQSIMKTSIEKKLTIPFHQKVNK